MNYMVHETFAGGAEEYRKATVKPRDDVEVILACQGWETVDVPLTPPKQRKECGAYMKLKLHFAAYKNWANSLAFLKKNDVVLIQFPVREHTVFLSWILKDLEKRGVHVLLLIHDMETIRLAKEKDKRIRNRLRLWYEERSCLSYASIIIAHNREMVKFLHEKCGIQKNKIVELEIFDYLMKEYSGRPQSLCADWRTVLVAGNLYRNKASYIYQLPPDIPVHLYGVGYDGKTTEAVRYHGSFPQEELPQVVEGGFGLVWDGDGLDGCSGIYGEYLRVNNPYKMSMYLALGIPVIIWEEAAQAAYVRKHGCGFCVGSINEIKEILNAMTFEEYQKYKHNAEKIGVGLRNGVHIISAVETALEKIGGGLLWLSKYRTEYIPITTVYHAERTTSKITFEACSACTLSERRAA